MSKSDIRFSYLRDPEAPGRVVTIARAIINGFIHYGYAVNSVTILSQSDLSALFGKPVTARTPIVVVNEKFCKSEGRSVAMSRLRSYKGCDILPVVEGTHPVVSVLEDMARKSKGHVGRTAAYYAARDGRGIGLTEPKAQPKKGWRTAFSTPVEGALDVSNGFPGGLPPGKFTSIKGKGGASVTLHMRAAKGEEFSPVSST